MSAAEFLIMSHRLERVRITRFLLFLYVSVLTLAKTFVLPEMLWAGLNYCVAAIMHLTRTSTILFKQRAFAVCLIPSNDPKHMKERLFIETSTTTTKWDQVVILIFYWESRRAPISKPSFQSQTCFNNWVGTHSSSKPFSNLSQALSAPYNSWWLSQALPDDHQNAKLQEIWKRGRVKTRLNRTKIEKHLV